MSSSHVFGDRQASETKDAWSSFARSRLDLSVRPRADLAGCGRITHLRSLDSELEAATAAIATLKRQRNALNTACSLPMELLCEIFRHAQKDWQPERARTHPDPPSEEAKSLFDLGWIYVTQVCTSWRQAAHGNAGLWTELRCLDMPPTLATNALHNCRELPLDLKIRYHFPWLANRPNQGLRIDDWLCPSIMERTRCLFISADPRTFNSWVPQLIRPDLAPILQDLTLSLSPGSAPNDWIVFNTSVFTGTRMPSLTSLTLLSCFPYWGTPFTAANVTRLRIEMPGTEDSAEDMGFLPEASHLNNFLFSFPLLEELSLQNIVPSDNPHPNFLQPPTLTSTLRVMRFGCTSPDLLPILSRFWDRFRAAPNTTVIFEAEIDEEFENALDDEGEIIIQALFSNDLAHPFRELHCSHNALSLCRSVSSSREEWVRVWPEMRYNSPLDLDANENTTDRMRGSVNIRTSRPAPDFLLPVRPDTFQALSFAPNIMDMYMIVTWLRHLPSPNIERIAIPYQQSSPLLAALVEASDLESDGQFALLPRLNIVVLHAGVQMDPHQEQPLQVEHEPQVDVAFMNLLRVRRERGAPIRELFISRQLMEQDVWGQVGEGVQVSFFD
ncbi:unnamed protein product [Peniophora sp. CBMAI 1063]|nr:unnamed protein product [Peniophora sp. CBMAI 1063]